MSRLPLLKANEARLLTHSLFPEFKRFREKSFMTMPDRRTPLVFRRGFISGESVHHLYPPITILILSSENPIPSEVTCCSCAGRLMFVPAGLNRLRKASQPRLNLRFPIFGNKSQQPSPGLGLGYRVFANKSAFTAPEGRASKVVHSFRLLINLLQCRDQWGEDWLSSLLIKGDHFLRSLGDPSRGYVELQYLLTPSYHTI